MSTKEITIQSSSSQKQPWKAVKEFSVSTGINLAGKFALEHLSLASISTTTALSIGAAQTVITSGVDAVASRVLSNESRENGVVTTALSGLKMGVCCALPYIDHAQYTGIELSEDQTFYLQAISLASTSALVATQFFIKGRYVEDQHLPHIVWKDDQSDIADQLDLHLLSQIFESLTSRDLKKTTCVSHKWRVVVDEDKFLMLRRYYFGKADWEKHFGDVGIEPPLPLDITEILNTTCPFWPESNDKKIQKVQDTHILVLIPETINGTTLTLNLLGALLKTPKEGYKTKYNYNEDYITKRELGNYPNPKSYWVLITKDVIPCSRNKRFEEQQALLEPPYSFPEALEMTTAIFMHYVRTGEELFPEAHADKLCTYTRCQETLEYAYNDRMVVGGFGSNGLDIGYFIGDEYSSHDYGLSALWRVK